MSLKFINSFSQFWGIVKEVNPENIEREADQRFKIIVIGPHATCNEKLTNAITAGQPTIGDSVQAVTASRNGDIGRVPSADLYIYALPGDQTGDVAVAHRVNDIEAGGKPVIIAVCNTGLADADHLLNSARYLFSTLPVHRIVVADPDDAAGVVSALFPVISRTLSHLNLSLGKHLPSFRDRVAENLILETSRVNAEFALFSSLPANIPVVGGIFSSGADLIVLTKNQIMLVLKLALIYGRSHESRIRTIAEVLPVVGGAFLWRTVARTLVGLLPGVASAVPKTLIAFTGTFVVGNGAKHYYQFGKRPSRKMIEQRYRDAIAEARGLLKAKN